MDTSDGSTSSASSSTPSDLTPLLNDRAPETAVKSTEVEDACDGDKSSTETHPEDNSERVTITGCPAELAVHGGQYVCARVVLNTMFLIRIYHAGRTEHGSSSFEDTVTVTRSQ